MTEYEFANKVAQLARLYGWRIAHFGTGQTNHGHRTATRFDARGFVDWTMVHPQRHLIWFRELKAGRNGLDEHQEQWKDWLNEAGANWDLWRERDLDDIVTAVSFGKARAS